MEGEGGSKGPCYYSVLGIHSDASFSDIRSAYHKLALKWHPDRCSKNSSDVGEAKRRFQKIQEAYSVLSDQGKRSMYEAGFLDLFEEDEKTRRLGSSICFCPPVLHLRYSEGRTIKVQTVPNYSQVKVFSIQECPTNSDSHVLFVHGLGCSSFAFQSILQSLDLKNVHAVAIDLQGSGFSDKSTVVVEEIVGGN